MRKYLTGLVAFIIMLFPMMVNADEITTASAPVWMEEEQYFIANGTPIVIEERDGVTYAMWEEKGEQKEQAITAGTIVIGGVYNPFSEGEGHVIDLPETSITMNSGSVWFISGGNAVDKNIDSYDKVHVGEVNITMNGGEVYEIAGISAAWSGYINVVIPAEKYAAIRDFYSVDTVNLKLNNASITQRVYLTSSYTYVGVANVDVTNTTIGKVGVGSGGVTFAHSSLSAGTNGKVGKFIVTIEDSNVAQLDAGLRAMVDEMEFNITGNTEMGDIFAGSGYAYESYSNSGTTAWTNYGWIPYGQVGKTTINIDSEVSYNNIYRGFQYTDVAGVSEYDTFYEKFGSNETVQKVAMGIENAKSAPVVITLASSPLVTDSDTLSILDAANENVTITYISKVEAPTVDTDTPVEVPTFGVNDSTSLDEALNVAIKDNAEVNAAVAAGETLTTAIEISKLESVSSETTTAVLDKLATINGTSNVVDYYDISVLIKNTTTDTSIANITELNSPLEFTVVLPEELQNVPEGYNRIFYMIREHNGEVELINTSLAEDGKSITFATDKFSTYALAYVDSLATTPENPSTIDNIMTYIVIGGIALVGAIGAAIYLKKHKEN